MCITFAVSNDRIFRNSSFCLLRNSRFHRVSIKMCFNIWLDMRLGLFGNISLALFSAFLIQKCNCSWNVFLTMKSNFIVVQYSNFPKCFMLMQIMRIFIRIYIMRICNPDNPVPHRNLEIEFKIVLATQDTCYVNSIHHYTVCATVQYGNQSEYL